MLFKKRKIYLSITLFAILLGKTSAYCQANPETLLYNWFDQKVGKENLDINNGTLYTNPYKTVGDNNMYFIRDKYELGNLTYEGLPYYNVSLKYDIYRDLLVLNPFGESEHTGVNLILDKVQSFSIKDITFVKIEKKDQGLSQFATGYYEEKKLAPDFTFYIKHHKDIQKGINDTGVFYNFKENNSFFIELKNTTTQIKSKNDIIKLFPEQKNQINGFYIMNRDLKKSDLNQFMKKLMRYINDALIIQTR
jgi:hypothetical protein